jgi:hypothetical protein
MVDIGKSTRLHRFLATLMVLLLLISISFAVMPVKSFATTATKPVAPANLLASVISGTQINLTWSDLSSNEVGFLLVRSTDSIFTTGLKSVLIGPDIGNYSDTSVSINTIYYYRLLAYNAVWVSDWAPSDTGFVVATTLPVVNSLPTSLIINQGDTFTYSVAFTDAGTGENWTAIIDYGDGSPADSMVVVASPVLINHLYTIPGSYTLTINVTDNFGGTGSASTHIIVRTPPSAVDGVSFWGAIATLLLLVLAFIWQLRGKYHAG